MSASSHRRGSMPSPPRTAETRATPRSSCFSSEGMRKSVPCGPSLYTPSDPFRGLTESVQEQRIRLQQAREEYGILKDSEDKLKKDVSAMAAQLKAKKAENQQASENVYSLVRQLLDESRSGRKDALQLKTQLCGLENEVKETKVQIAQAAEESESLRKEIAALELLYENLPATRPLDSASIFGRIWPVLIAKDQKTVKRRLQRKVEGMNKSKVEDWLRQLNVGLQKRDIARAVGKAVRNGQFHPPAFLAIMWRWQPHPVFEDVEPVLAHLRIRLALNNLERGDVEQAFSQVTGAETASTLSQPPFSLDKASVSCVLGYLGGQPVSSLLQHMPECPTLNFVKHYVRCWLAYERAPLEEAVSLIPVPFSLQGLCAKLQLRLNLTADAALILSSALSSETPRADLIKILQLEVTTDWIMENMFNEFVDNILKTDWESRLLNFPLLPTESVESMHLVIADFSGNGKLASLSAFFTECERLLGERLCEEHRLAIEAECLRSTQVIGALNEMKIRQKIKQRECDGAFNSGEDEPIPPVDDFGA